MAYPASPAHAESPQPQKPAENDVGRLIALMRLIVTGPAAASPVCDGPVGRIIDYLRAIDRGARRRLILSTGAGPTPDETALANLLIAAQAGDEDGCRLRARWLVRKAHAETLVEAAFAAGEALALAGVHFRQGAPSGRPPGPFRPLTSVGGPPPAQEGGAEAPQVYQRWAP